MLIVKRKQQRLCNGIAAWLLILAGVKGEIDAPSEVRIALTTMHCHET